MRDILDDIKRWQLEGKGVALATVVKIYGSAPRGLGAKLAVSEDSEISGSVSGGCIEGAVVREGLQIIKTGIPKLVEYGISDSEAMEVGLSCGGIIQVFIEKIPLKENIPFSAENLFPYLLTEIEADHFTCTATIISGKNTGRKLLVCRNDKMYGDLEDEYLNEMVQDLLEDACKKQETSRITLPHEEEVVEIFLDVFTPRKKLVIIGAVHIAIPLIHFAKKLDYECIVIDARAAFATRERFPHTDQLIVGWPSEELQKIRINETTAIVLLTHDDKMDIPSLVEALRTPAHYIGILGSPKTHAKRIHELSEYGVTEEQLARVHAPIGLDIGARGPQEIALSIMAEIIAVKHGK